MKRTTCRDEEPDGNHATLSVLKKEGASVRIESSLLFQIVESYQSGLWKLCLFFSLCNDLLGDIYNHKYFGGLLSNLKWVGLVKKHDTIRYRYK